MYRDTCMPWIEDTRNCAVCGEDTGSNDMLCDDCHEHADNEERQAQLSEDRHFYANER